MGVPQYLWRETPQSLRRKMVSFFPKLFASAKAAIFSLAASVGRPLNWPELMLTPYSVKASVGSLADIEDPDAKPVSGIPADTDSIDRDGATTARMGRLYFLQNSKSRSSCAGTAMTAPVPYSSRTKFPTQIGRFSSLKGFTTNLPVKKPSFSAVSTSSAFTDIDLSRANFFSASACTGEPSSNFGSIGWFGARISAVAP